MDYNYSEHVGYVIYQPNSETYFGIEENGLLRDSKPRWYSSFRDAYWFSTATHAANIIREHNFERVVIREIKKVTQVMPYNV